MATWRKLSFVVLASTLVWSSPPQSAASELAAPTAVPVKTPSSSALTLEKAIEKALESNPYLATFPWELRAADARILQAGLRPNPELSLEIEGIRLGERPDTQTNKRGSDFQLPLSGNLPSLAWSRESTSSDGGFLGEAELTLSISQPIERGKKRARRIALSQQEKALVQWDYESARADVIGGVAQSFVALLVAQEQLAMNKEMSALAADVARSIALRIEAGKVSPLEGNKADIAYATTQIDQELSERELRAKRAALASWWGGRDTEINSAHGELLRISPLPSLTELTADLSQNPDLARWATELMQREALLAVERSKRKLDPTVVFGIRSTGVSGDSASEYGFSTGGGFSGSRSRSGMGADRESALILGFSVPLPLFNRNQGRIAEAEARIAKGGAERRSIRMDAEAAITSEWYRADAMVNALARLDAEVLPKATETFEKTQIGYRAGKFSYLDVLDAQRTLFEARNTYLEKIASFHQARIAVERLIGAVPAGAFNPTTPNAEPQKEITHD